MRAAARKQTMNTRVWCCQGRSVFCDCVAIYWITKQRDASHGAHDCAECARSSSCRAILVHDFLRTRKPHAGPRVHAIAKNNHAMLKITLGLLTNSPPNPSVYSVRLQHQFWSASHKSVHTPEQRIHEWNGNECRYAYCDHGRRGFCWVQWQTGCRSSKRRCWPPHPWVRQATAPATFPGMLLSSLQCT